MKVKVSYLRETRSNRVDSVRILRKFGIRRYILAEYGAWMQTIFMIAAAIVLGIVTWVYEARVDPANVTVAVLGVGAFVIGLRQFLMNQEMTSYESFYARLDIVNSRLNEWPSARSLVSQFWGKGDDETFQRMMYVYNELDNLEYWLVKYQRGFMHPDDALRGLLLFQSRCNSTEFSRLALLQVDNAGYKSVTQDVVHRLCVTAIN